uniref:Uncharacterized protein n=1 Tax=Anguilla anguilla TaxID=7936 RepID=A0A0E9TDV5_ANGAN
MNIKWEFTVTCFGITFILCTDNCQHPLMGIQWKCNHRGFLRQRE